MIWKNIRITILCINLLCGLIIISVKTLFYKGKNEDMVDITKLRIGNYIYKKSQYINEPVGGTLIKITLDIFIDISHNPSGYEYAEINKEFLFKKGFSEYHEEGYKKGDFLLDKDFYVVNGFDYYDCTITSRLLYIHELQNAYLLFIGEELD